MLEVILTMLIIGGPVVLLLSVVVVLSHCLGLFLRSKLGQLDSRYDEKSGKERHIPSITSPWR